MTVANIEDYRPHIVLRDHYENKYHVVPFSIMQEIAEGESIDSYFDDGMKDTIIRAMAAVVCDMDIENESD